MTKNELKFNYEIGDQIVIRITFSSTEMYVYNIIDIYKTGDEIYCKLQGRNRISFNVSLQFIDRYVVKCLKTPIEKLLYGR